MELVKIRSITPKNKATKCRIAPKTDPYLYCHSCHLYDKQLGCWMRWCLPRVLREKLARSCIQSSAVPYTRRPKDFELKF